jgi:hypothetical protein
MIRLISLGMVCVLAVLSLAFATKDITLKKLYDPIEDFQVEHKNSSANEFRLSRTEEKRVNDIAQPALVSYLKRSGRWEKYCTDAFNGAFSGLNVYRVNIGSFTRIGAKQFLYTFSFCEPIEYYGCLPSVSGVAILEDQRLIAMYTDETCAHVSFSVSDINQNGLRELMLVVPIKPDAETTSIRLLEFPDGKIRNLGDVPVGVQLGNDEIFPSEFCANNVYVPVTKKTFSSNIIYVLKSSTPQFFSEQYDVNCNYRSIGVKARKVRNLTPIKPVLRPSGFTRIF